MNYENAAASAKQAFAMVLTVAAQADVQVEPQSYTADYKGQRPQREVR